MARLLTCSEENLSESTLAALEPVRMKGKLADVYLEFANSEPAIKAYLAMEDALRGGSLNEQELECVKLLLSQITQCDFCLSVHSFKSTHAGLDKATQLNIRQEKATGNTRLDLIVRLVSTLFKQPGPLSDAFLQEARDAGFSDENLVDICMAMSTIFFTNITNHINHSISSLPAAPALGDD